jgi:hypothetical protein
MPKGIFLGLAIALATSSLVHGGETLVAIRRAGGGGWGATTQYGMKFNPNAIVILQGKILDVRKFTPMRRMAYGYLVTLQTKEGILKVHIGPGWYVNRFDFPLNPGDTIVVRGSRIRIHDSEAIMAMEVQKGEDVLKLRRDDGVPVWSTLEKSKP